MSFLLKMKGLEDRFAPQKLALVAKFYIFLQAD